ncbi:MAG: PqqD family protein [Nitrososphaerota archaeon]
MRWLFRRRRPQPLAVSFEELLRMVPVKNPRAESTLTSSGEITVKLRIPQPKSMLARLLPVPEYRTFVLDKIGGFVWEAMDGERNVSAIAQILVSNFKMTREEAEISLLRYLQILASRGLVYFSAEKEQGGERKGQRLNQSE